MSEGAEHIGYRHQPGGVPVPIYVHQVGHVCGMTSTSQPTTTGPQATDMWQKAPTSASSSGTPSQIWPQTTPGLRKHAGAPPGMSSHYHTGSNYCLGGWPQSGKHQGLCQGAHTALRTSSFPEAASCLCVTTSGSLWDFSGLQSTGTVWVEWGGKAETRKSS